MKSLLDKYNCPGCLTELEEFENHQSDGYDTGLTFDYNHCSFFVLDKRGEFIIK